MSFLNDDPDEVQADCMEAGKMAKYRKKLEEMARDLRSSLEGSAEDTAPVELDTSIGRLSRMDAIQSQQMAVALKQRQQQQLMRVENALKAIDEERYGKCRKCGAEIAEERLEAQPDAVLCVRCASQKGG